MRPNRVSVRRLWVGLSLWVGTSDLPTCVSHFCPYPKRPFPLAGPVVAVPTVSSHVEFKSLLACFLGSSGLRPVPVQRFLSEHISRKNAVIGTSAHSEAVLQARRGRARDQLGSAAR